ncbi:hypothetical protein F9U44_02915 [Pectobacterium versatile]|uniref:hypothetical protein n=1 Tax=Pectobacterium versatile TaxID=2488639 RepID=UPI001B3A7498|nr:hypothetical protein [Pectobacterium versatile]MBQ4770431.1 hypothetical protein [Pectobacterium versatile]
MKRKILLFFISSFLILLVAGYLAVTDNPYSGIATSIVGCFIGAIIVLAAKAICFKRKISQYDVSAITVFTVLFSLGTAISGLLLSNSAPLIKALITSAILLAGGLIAFNLFHRSNKSTTSGNE